MKYTLLFLFLPALLAAQPTDTASAPVARYASWFQVRAISPDSLHLFHQRAIITIDARGVEVLPDAPATDINYHQYLVPTWVKENGTWWGTTKDGYTVTWYANYTYPFIEISTPSLVWDYYKGLPDRMRWEQLPDN
jgi:hypothetical protein